MIGSEIIKLLTIDSTNNYLKLLLETESPKDGTLADTREQTLGRGQRENMWHSNPGENLTFSFVIYPVKLSAIDQFMLSKFVSLALFDFLANYSSFVKVKWPNDIYIKNKKISGILIENVIKGQWISSTVVGIGLNINQIQFADELNSATSLAMETGTDFKLETLLDQLIKALNIRYKQLKDGKWEELDNDYLHALFQYEEFALYQANNVNFEARIVNVEKDGRLILTNRMNEQLKFAFKDVQFL